MGGKFTCNLNSKERRYISERVADIMEKLAPLYHGHFCSNLLNHMRHKHMELTEPRPLIQSPDDVAHAEIVLEGTMPQYLEGLWTHRHLQVTSSFTVESRDTKEVFEGGWVCKTELVLSGSQICTSIREHREIVDDMCRHITGKSDGRLACWNCPTAFPVFIQHPYCVPVCLATASSQDQTRWANMLRAATQHHSSGPPLDSPESRAFFDAVATLKRLRGNSQAAVQPMGSEEEVLVTVVMEEVMSYLKVQVFPRIIVHHSRRKRKQVWIKLLWAVYRMTGQQVKAALAALKEEVLLHRPDVERQISAGLQQAALLHDCITDAITEDMYAPMLQSLLQTIIPRLDRTLQEVATPICDGFASTWRYFLETCEDVMELASKTSLVKDMKKEVLTPLGGLRPDDGRMWQCLNRLELSVEERAWLQETWGVPSGTWRPLVLKAQNELYKVVDVCAVMFWRMVLRYPCSFFSSAELTAVLCRVKDRVVKHLDTQLSALRSQLILEVILHITLPAFARDVGSQDLSHYAAMVRSDQAVFIRPDIIFRSILRDNLASYVQSVMRYSLPQQFVPLPVIPSNPCSSGCDFLESAYRELLLPGDRQTADRSGSETLTPRPPSDPEDTSSADSENSDRLPTAVFDAGEYVRLSEP